jgi:predicted deacylase
VTPQHQTELHIGNTRIAPGESKVVQIPVAPMYTHEDLSITVQVLRGRKPGPTLFVSAAIHGDEINGVEVIRRLLQYKAMQSLRGTLLAVPIVNVYGFLNGSRYLPDGRDLNRSFPGSAKGSLTGRVAHAFFNEIVLQSTHGIDLHTGARHRSNYPQIRADLEQQGVLAMIEAFGVPLALNAKLRDGSLRACAQEAGIPVILYEAGEALRFDELYIRAGLKGIVSVMRCIGMLGKSRRRRPPLTPVISQHTSWLRAPESGMLRMLVPLGGKVTAGQVIATVADPLGAVETPMTATSDGIVIGRTNLPLVYEGDAAFHIAHYGNDVSAVEEDVAQFQEELQPVDSDLGRDDLLNAPTT